MKKIKEIIVVEGLHDQQKLQSCFDCDCLVTHGSYVSAETLQLIKQLNQQRGVIVFTDDDTPGRQIRTKIQAACGEVKHAYIDKKLSKTKTKVGVEHANCADLLASLNNVMTLSDGQSSLAFEEYLSLGFMDHGELRLKLCQHLGLPMMNNKRLFKTLNQLNLNKQQVKEILDGDDC